MEHKDSQVLRDRMQLVLRGPDGEIKETRDSQEDSDGTDTGHGIQEQAGD